MIGMHTFALSINKLTTSAYSPSGNGGIERVYHAMAKILAMVCNEHQNDWGAHLIFFRKTITLGVTQREGGDL